MTGLSLEFACFDQFFEQEQILKLFTAVGVSGDVDVKTIRLERFLPCTESSFPTASKITS
jgi:hypothetical protein